MSAAREPVPFEIYESGLYLHGTKADLAVGDLLVSGRESNFEAGRVMNYVYFSATLDAAVEALRDYERLHDEGRDRTDQYRQVLAAAPWKRCECAVCRDVGIQVNIFRGTERNKRRGFHNLHVFARRFDAQLQRDRSLSTASTR